MALEMLTDEELLQKVKSALGIGGTYQDTTLTVYIDEVKEYLEDAGVDTNLINSNKAVGVICRGVSDLWNYGSGDAKLSLYFMQRVAQLAYKKVVTDDELSVDN